MPYLMTKLHVYSHPSGSDAHRALHAQLADRLPDAMHALELLSDRRDAPAPLEPGVYTVAIDPAHLFTNQWNTADDAGDEPTRGRRVFNWYEAMRIGPGAPVLSGRGHWLEITNEMRKAQRETVACGFCGKQAPIATAGVFCPHCIDSPYLKESELYLTRLRPVYEERSRASRPPLTDSEAAWLVPKYRDAQIHGATERGNARMAKVRTEAVDKARRAIQHAQDERDGVLWLLDHGVSTENVIYYSHTGRFCFGWRRPVTPAEYSALCDVLTEFPFDYDIKREGSK